MSLDKSKIMHAHGIEVRDAMSYVLSLIASAIEYNREHPEKISPKFISLMLAQVKGAYCMLQDKPDVQEFWPLANFAHEEAYIKTGTPLSKREE